MNDSAAVAKISALPCCQGATNISPLSGGMTNQNFKVILPNDTYVVRLGENVPEHLILRANEHAASVAAAKAGISPEVIHHEPGVLVIRFIDGKVYEADDIVKKENLDRIVPVLKDFHHRMPNHYQGYPMLFWAFQVLQHYQNVLENVSSPHIAEMQKLSRISDQLQQDVGQVDIVFGHNDLLPANFIDDGEKIWLIDFDYAGFNSPLFDLANLASNSEMVKDLEQHLLSTYLETDATEQVWRSYSAMKCASLLRETVWSMISESYSTLDVDYAAYTAENRQRFEVVWEQYQGDFK